MNIAQALYSFMASFGIPAYEENSVPSGDNTIDMPYLTYSFSTDYLGTETPLIVNLWYYTSSNSIPNAKVEEIANVIGMGGKLIPFENGAMWIKRGSPFSQSLAEDTEPMIKRRYINLILEYLR